MDVSHSLSLYTESLWFYTALSEQGSKRHLNTKVAFVAGKVTSAQGLKTCSSEAGNFRKN